MMIIIMPLLLGAAVWTFRKLWAQLACIAVAAVISSVIVLVEEVIPQGGFDHHGNTWQGYALIVPGPFLLGCVVVAILRSLDTTERIAKPLVVAVCVPLSYWLGLLFFLSIAVSFGFAAE